MKKSQINALVSLWLICYTGLAWAATSLRADLKDLDYWSLLLAAAAGLVGGAGRTLISLMSESRPLFDIRYEVLKDIIVACIGGAVTYGVIQGYNYVAALKLFGVMLPIIGGDLRIIIIVIAGASRGKWMRTIDQGASDLVDSARRKIRGGVPVDPTSVVAPLEGK
jgi:hypothetical protein